MATTIIDSDYYSISAGAVVTLDFEAYTIAYAVPAKPLRKDHSMTQPGIMVVVEGPDGSGKSTVIDGLVTYFQDGNQFSEVAVLHLKPGWLPPLRYYISPRQWGRPITVGPPVINPHGTPTSGLVGSFARWIYYLTDYVLGYRRVVAPLLTQGALVLFDRYYFDYALDPTRMRILLPQALLLAALPVVPPPSLLLYLDAPPKDILRRKRELPAAEIQRQRLAWHTLLPRLHYARRLDATRPAQEVIAQAIEALRLTEKDAKR